MDEFTFAWAALTQGFDAGSYEVTSTWITSTQRVNSKQVAIERAQTWLGVCLENDFPVAIRIVEIEHA